MKDVRSLSSKTSASPHFTSPRSELAMASSGDGAELNNAALPLPSAVAAVLRFSTAYPERFVRGVYDRLSSSRSSNHPLDPDPSRSHAARPSLAHSRRMAFDVETARDVSAAELLLVVEDEYSRISSRENPSGHSFTNDGAVGNPSVDDGAKQPSFSHEGQAGAQQDGNSVIAGSRATAVNSIQNNVVSLTENQYSPDQQNKPENRNPTPHQDVGETVTRHEPADESATSGAPDGQPQSHANRHGSAEPPSLSGSGGQAPGERSGLEADRLRALRAENRRLRARNACRLCRQRPVSLTLLPCGHFCFCQECGSSFAACPLCHKTILADVRTFTA